MSFKGFLAGFNMFKHKALLLDEQSKVSGEHIFNQESVLNHLEIIKRNITEQEWNYWKKGMKTERSSWRLSFKNRKEQFQKSKNVPSPSLSIKETDFNIEGKHANGVNSQTEEIDLTQRISELGKHLKKEIGVSSFFGMMGSFLIVPFILVKEQSFPRNNAQP